MRHKSFWKSVLFRHIFSVSEGLVWLASGVLSGALLVWWLGVPGVSAVKWFMRFVWCVASFVAGRRSGLHGRKHGIRTGLVCGMLLSGILLAGGALTGADGAEMLRRSVLVLFAGAAGGIVGVNTRLRKPPY